MTCTPSTTTAAVRRRATPPRRPGRATVRRIGSLLSAGLLSASALVLLAGPAGAHDNLTGSTPADGATISTAPERVRLTFSEQVQDIGLTVLVKDPSGASVTDGAPTIDGRAVVQPLGALESAGVYTVAYRVVSSDGHPISGRLTFTLDLPTAATSSPSAPASSSSPAASPSSPSSPAAPTQDSSSVAAAPAAATSESGSSAAWLVAGAGLLAVLVVVGVVLARRRSA